LCAGDGVCAFVVAIETVIGARPDMAVPVFEQLGDKVIGNAVRPFTDHPFTGTVKTQHAVIKRAEPEETIAILNNSEAGLATDVEYILEFHRRCRCVRKRHNGQPHEQDQQCQAKAVPVSAEAACPRND